MCHALAVPGYMREWLHWPKWSKNSSVSRITSRKKPRSSACVARSFNTTPSMVPCLTSILPIGPVGAHEIVGCVVRRHGFARVAPEPLEDVVLHEAPFQVPVVDVGDLQLSTTRWLELGKDRPDRLVIEVHARHRVIARGLLWFFHDPLDRGALVALG